jgi:putative ATP-binding cassette transporter
MNLLTYLYRHSWRLLIFATVCGVVSGLCGAGVVALIGRGVEGGVQPWQTGLLFFALCLLQLTTKSMSEIALLRSTQNTILSLRVELSRRLLATPLKRLQELGKPGLLVILTKDVDTFIAAFQMLPAIRPVPTLRLWSPISP